MDDWTTSPRALTRRNAEGWTFFTEAVRDFRTTGAVAPSGRTLARRLTDPLRAPTARPLNVLEAGAGTGSVTRAVIPLLSRDSRLDIVESNERFVERLRHLISTHPDLAADRERVRVHHTLVEQLDTRRRYDVIVSGLPFTNFHPEQVEAIMDRYLDLLHPGGALTYFTYLGTRRARSLLGGRADASRHRAVEEVLARRQRRYATACRTVWGNLPPAKVLLLRRPSEPATDPVAHPHRAGAGNGV
ncbi:methyltransferase [Streptomyces sp. NPDC002012]|uniref:class I SAM-dependent methyltransferase n=1 Tax=unclassified Streptomyces TaxID=2593676 RepID=UPI00332ABF87